MSVEIMEFDVKNATDQEYEAFTNCRNLIRAERLPDDPPIPLEESIQGLKNIPDFVKVKPWVAQAEAGEIAGYGLIQYSMDDNLHMAQFVISILPAYRRRGLGKAFLSRIVNVAQQESRRLLLADTIDRVPAGEAFMKRIGASKGIEGHTNQLKIAELDHDLIKRWIERAQDRAEDFEIGFWEGKYPEKDIEAIVELHDLLNQQPFGDLDIEDFTFTPDHLRQSETSLFARGYERWTLFVREKETGKFAGYTEVLWNSHRPDLISQGMTGVFPEFRNKGLGRWLKAEMLDRILKGRPQAKIVRTDNADMNAPMMKINNELGFKPYMAEALWQVETEKAAEYLAK
jgi:GNAT superfamily N-acetyltransferase